VAVPSAGPYARLHLFPDTITTQAPHHSVFYRPDALPAAQPTVKALKAIMIYIYSTYSYIHMYIYNVHKT